MAGWNLGNSGARRRWSGPKPPIGASRGQTTPYPLPQSRHLCSSLLPPSHRRRRARFSFAVNSSNTTIELLTGSNYKKWKQDIEFALGIVDIDLALREKEPPKPTTTSTAEEKEYYAKWDRSNRLSLIAIKRSISEHLMSGLPETNNAKEFFDVVGARYHVSSKAEAGSLMNELTSMKYDSQSGVREYILKLVFVQSKLNGLKVLIPDDFIVYQALNSLPSDFSQIKTAYNTQNQNWTINDLIAKCVLEEEKLKKEKSESAFVVSNVKFYPGRGHGNKWKTRFNTSHKVQDNNKQGKGKGQTQNVLGPNAVIKKEVKCLFCKEKGHIRRDCTKFQAWLEKKKWEGGVHKPKEAK